MALARPQRMFAQERETVLDGVAGDVIGAALRERAGACGAFAGPTARNLHIATGARALKHMIARAVDCVK